MLKLDPRCTQLTLEETTQQVHLRNTGCNKGSRFKECLMDRPLAHVLVYCITMEKNIALQ